MKLKILVRKGSFYKSKMRSLGNWDVPIAEIKKELQALVSGKH
jgi:hypothetical protein